MKFYFNKTLRFILNKIVKKVDMMTRWPLADNKILYTKNVMVDKDDNTV